MYCGWVGGKGGGREGEGRGKGGGREGEGRGKRGRREGEEREKERGEREGKGLNILKHTQLTYMV